MSRVFKNLATQGLSKITLMYVFILQIMSDMDEYEIFRTIQDRIM